MVTIIDERFDRRKTIDDLAHIPNKGDILVYNDNEISIKGVGCSISHNIYEDTFGVSHDITIKVY